MEFSSLRVLDWLQGIDRGLSERSALFNSVLNWKIPGDCFATAWQLSGDFFIIAWQQFGDYATKTDGKELYYIVNCQMQREKWSAMKILWW